MPVDPQRPWTLVVADPADLWSTRLIDQCPRPRLVVDPAEFTPEAWPDPALSARHVVVHTPTLSGPLLGGLTDLRRALPPSTPFLLCQQPLNRYHQVQPHAGLFSTTLPETTAVETLDRHLRPEPRGPIPALPVAVVSRLNELGGWLREVCASFGLSARHVGDWSEPVHEPLAVWDLPWLDEGWEAVLRREARRRPIVVVAGFLDRPLVERLRALGARAVLDLPCDLADLAHVLGRLMIALPGQRTHFLDTAGATPPGPSARRRIVIPHGSQAHFPGQR